MAIKTTAAKTPTDGFNTAIGAWTNYGSGLLDVSDDGGKQSSSGMTIELKRLVLFSLGFTPNDIPLGSKITGITLTTEGHGNAASAGARGLRAHLCLGSGVDDAGGTVPAGARVGNRAAWTMNLTTDTVDVRTTDGTANNGDPLWGFPWTPEAIFDPTFGVVFSSDSGTPAGAGEERLIDFLSIAILYDTGSLGYYWWPRVRIASLNGLDANYDLRALLTDAGGPVKIEPDYAPSFVNRTTINQNLSPLKRGYRPEAILTFEIRTMADQVTLATIESALMDPEKRVYLSLDGGATEREVVIGRRDGPNPLGGKTFVGGRWMIGFRSVALDREIPNIITGAW